MYACPYTVYLNIAIIIEKACKNSRTTVLYGTYPKLLMFYMELLSRHYTERAQ